jgi:DnaJ homolog subfamily C member 27
VNKHISTIGVDYGVKKTSINGIPIKLVFWDLAGSPEYLEVRNEFYQDTELVRRIECVCWESASDLSFL